MIRKIPIFPTIFVLICVTTMICLGLWQLDRVDEKAVMIGRYQSIGADAPAVTYPANDAELDERLYRITAINCLSVINMRSTAGTNVVGVKGWAHVARCAISSPSAGSSPPSTPKSTGSIAEVALGWSRDPNPPVWTGGQTVTGVLAPGGKIIADPALADLGPLAKPDPADLPNNHLAYAGQWFLFAFTALVIYSIALRRRIQSTQA